MLLFYVLVFWPPGMWDVISLTRDTTHTPCIGRRSLNHWTAREVPKSFKILGQIESQVTLKQYLFTQPAIIKYPNGKYRSHLNTKKLTIYYQKQLNILRKLCPLREKTKFGFCTTLPLKLTFLIKFNLILASPDHEPNSVFFIHPILDPY